MFFYLKKSSLASLLALVILLGIAQAWAAARGVSLASLVRWSWQAVALGVAVWGADSVFNYAIYWLNRNNTTFLRKVDVAIHGLFGKATPLTMLMAGLMAAVGEEPFFRGMIQQEFRQAWGVNVGIIASAVCFTFAHVGRRDILLFSLWSLPQGIIFGLIYQWTGNLLVTMVTHGLYDAATIGYMRYFYRPVTRLKGGMES